MKEIKIFKSSIFKDHRGYLWTSWEKNKIKIKDEKDLQYTLSTGIKLYEKYIDPKKIIKFIESNLIEHD